MSPPRRLVLPLLLGLPGAAAAFSSVDGWGGNVHAALTRAAEARLARAGDYRPFPAPGRSLDRILQLQDGLDLAVSGERVQQGLAVFPRVRAAVVDKVRDVVPTGLYQPEHHFFRDGRLAPGAPLPRSADAFALGVTRYQDHVARAVARAQDQAFGCAQIDLGLALHAVQDLYAHSNLAELDAGLPPFADAGAPGKAAVAEVTRCLAPGAAPCDPALLDGQLLLTYFPSWEPTLPGPRSVGFVKGDAPGSVPCPDPEGGSDAGCYTRGIRVSQWEEAVEQACAAALATEPRPTEATYSHTCFSKESGHPVLTPATGESWAPAWDHAREMAVAQSAVVLGHTFAALSTAPTPPTSRCTEATLWDCLVVADRRECPL